MLNCHKVYRAVHQGIIKALGFDVKGNQARHLNVMVGFICGIVQSGEVKLSEVASEIPKSGQEESKIMQLRRWLKNESIDVDLYYLPYIKKILKALARQTIVLIIDGSTTASGCVTLMVSVLYKGRAIPVLWVTRKGKKGHFPETMHIELIRAVQSLIPIGADVICLGDGEFDGSEWLNTIRGFGWNYVCRTSKDAALYEEGERFRLPEVCPERGGQPVYIEGLEFTDKRSAIVNAVAWWGISHKNPIFWVTSFKTADEAHFWYCKRFRIETLFSDMKSRGFNLHKSGLKCPKRVSRLLIAAALAYIWMIYLGEYALKNGWQTLIHRKKRCDLSLFKLGVRLLKRLLSNNLTLPLFSIDLKVTS
jgi:hypothetical protein